MATCPVPDHVPEELIVDADIYALSGREADPQLKTLRNLNTREDYVAALADAGLEEI